MPTPPPFPQASGAPGRHADQGFCRCSLAQDERESPHPPFTTSTVITSFLPRRMRRDRALAMDDLVDAPRRDAQVLRQPVLREVEGPKELLLENLAGVYWGQFLRAHGALSVVIARERLGMLSPSMRVISWQRSRGNPGTDRCSKHRKGLEMRRDCLSRKLIRCSKLTRSSRREEARTESPMNAVLFANRNIGTLQP